MKYGVRMRCSPNKCRAPLCKVAAQTKFRGEIPPRANKGVQEPEKAPTYGAARGSINLLGA